MLEVEVKAVLASPQTVRERLTAAGAEKGFRGRLIDLRLDRNGELVSRDEVLRVRSHRAADETEAAEITWKGPVAVNDRGQKARHEITVPVGSGHQGLQLLSALGYRTIHRIDRFVEYYELAGTQCRIEWYPRMDVLLEVEADPDAIEAVIPILDIPRDQFSPDPLDAFVTRYESRTGQPGILELDQLDGDPPWPDS